MNILVVDDEPAVCRLVTSYLAALGHNVTVSRNAVAAREAAATEEIDALLLDLELPDMCGDELYRRIVDDHGAKPVIFMSAHNQGPKGELFLCKPFGKKDLEQTLSQAGCAAQAPDHRP